MTVSFCPWYMCSNPKDPGNIICIIFLTYAHSGICLPDSSPIEENLAVCLFIDLDSFVPNITKFDKLFWAIMPPDHLVAHRSRISNIDPDSGSPRTSSATAMTAKVPMYCSSLNGDAYPCDHPMGQSDFMFKILSSCSRGHANAMSSGVLCYLAVLFPCPFILHVFPLPRW